MENIFFLKNLFSSLIEDRREFLVSQFVDAKFKNLASEAEVELNELVEFDPEKYHLFETFYYSNGSKIKEYKIGKNIREVHCELLEYGVKPLFIAKVL